MPYCRLIFNNNGQDPTFVKLEGCDINVLKSNVLNAERKKSVLVEDIMKLKSLISHHEDQLDILGQRLYDLRTHNTPASPRATVSSRRRSKDDVALSSTGKANGRRHRSTKSLFHEEVKTRSHRHHKSESHELENELFDTGTELQQELSEAKEHLDILETELQTLLTTQYESFPKSPSLSASLFAHRSKPFKSIIEIMNDLELENWQLVQCYTFIEENVQPQKNDNINKTSSNSSKSSARPLSGEVIANVFGNADLPEKISPRSTELSPQRETKVGRRSLVEKSQVAKLFGQTPQQRSTQPAAATSSNSSPAMDSLVHEKLPAATRGHSYDGVNVDVSRLSLNADGFAKRSTTINTSKSSEIRHVYVFHRPMKEVEWREVPTPRTVDDASDTSLPPLPRNLFESRELALPPIPKNKSK